MWSSHTWTTSLNHTNNHLAHVTTSVNLESITLNDRRWNQDHILNDSVSMKQPEWILWWYANWRGPGGEREGEMAHRHRGWHPSGVMRRFQN